MKQKRLPMLRVSAELHARLTERAKRQGLSLAEAHRQALSLVLQENVLIIPVVGTSDGQTIQWLNAGIEAAS